MMLQEERDSFSKLLIGGGFTDAWRRQHPEITGYTYWNYRFNTRTSNKGWRLDYFLVSSNLHICTFSCLLQSLLERIMHSIANMLRQILCVVQTTQAWDVISYGMWLNTFKTAR